MSDTKKFEWRKMLVSWSAEVGSLVDDGGEVHLRVTPRPPGEAPAELPWRFRASLWLVQTSSGTTTIQPPWVEGFCETREEAQAEAERFGYQLLEVSRILAPKGGV